MAEKMLAGQKELARTSAREKAKEGNMTLAEAEAGLRASYRQAKRIWKTYRENGAFGPAHGSRGRASNNRTAEKLKENEGVAVSGETPRRRLMAAGLWERKRKSHPYRSRRPAGQGPRLFAGTGSLGKTGFARNSLLWIPAFGKPWLRGLF
jgi:hypothetical protein